MEDELKWIVGGCLAFFMTLFGGIVFSDYLESQQKMECIKQRGEWIGKTCVFRAH